ncbi:hypothetical protein GMSM_46810 [Geomonas sp. Red276]
MAKAFGEAHRLYTRMENFREDVRGYLFQGRFASCVLDERHLVAAARYVELNPVRANMVEKAWDYEWSSARFHMGKKSTDLLVGDRSLMGLVENWSELLEDDDEEANRKLRSGVKIGRPIGSESFVHKMEEITGRDLGKHKAGRPSKK